LPCKEEKFLEFLTGIWDTTGIILALFTRRKEDPIENIRNILFIKLAAIGDAICLSLRYSLKALFRTLN
jgi:hypothetical protein